MAAKIPVLKGDRFGALVVEEVLEYRTEPSGHRRSWVRTRCDCGRSHDVCTLQLTRGVTSRCAECATASQRAVMIGDRFDKLTVVGFDKGERTLAECRCDCGSIVKIRPCLLRKNMTNNCGCDPRGRWKGHKKLSGTYFSKLRRGAACRDFCFDVTPVFLWELFERQQGKCALSGLPIQLGRTLKGQTASVDRIDSCVGYTNTNVHWVHKDINLMKMNLSLERFVELCGLVAQLKREDQ